MQEGAIYSEVRKWNRGDFLEENEMSLEGEDYEKQRSGKERHFRLMSQYEKGPEEGNDFFKIKWFTRL